MDCSMTILRIALTGFFISAAYIYLLNRLANFAHPMRLKLATEGRNILSRQDVSEPVRRQVEFSLSHAFSPWMTVIASLVFPIALISAIISAVRRQAGPMRTDRERKDTVRIGVFFTFSVIAANPLFGMVLLAEYAAISFLLIVTLDQVGILRVVAAELADLEDRITQKKFAHIRLGSR